MRDDIDERDERDGLGEPDDLGEDGREGPYEGDATAIATLANEEVVCIAPTATLRDAARMLEANGVGCVVVCVGTTVEGVVSERDIVRAVADGIDLDATTTAEVESKDLKWALPDSSILEVAEEMMEGYVRHVLVGDDHRIVGVVSMRDVLGSLLV